MIIPTQDVNEVDSVKIEFAEVVYSESFISELSDRKSATNIKLLSDKTITIETFLTDKLGKPLEWMDSRYTQQTFKKLMKALRKIEKRIK